MLQQSPDPLSENDEVWDREYELWLFHNVANWLKNEFQSKTWEAFWKTAVEGREVVSVAAELGMSAGAIYIAKSRVLARIRTEVQQIESWERP